MMKYPILILFCATICIPNQAQAQLFKKKNKKEQTDNKEREENNSNYVYFEGFTGYSTEYSEATAVECNDHDATDLAYEESPEFDDNVQDIDFEDVIAIPYESYQAQPERATAVDDNALDATSWAYEESPEFDDNAQDVYFKDLTAMPDESTEVQPERGSAFKRFSNVLHSKLFPSVPEKTDGMSIAAMCCGICGLLIFGFGVLGITFGAIGLRNTSENGTRGRGMAITGLVTGTVKLIIVIASLALLF